MSQLRPQPNEAQPSVADDAPLYPGNSFNPPRPLVQALLRGLICRCPSCGVGRLFHRFLKVTPFCKRCGEALHHARPDDAPAYFVMLLVGHIVVPMALALEETLAPPLLITAIVLAVVAGVLGVALLPPVKGGIVALQWTFWMHGFDPHEPRDDLFDMAAVADGKERNPITAATEHFARARD